MDKNKVNQKNQSLSSNFIDSESLMPGCVHQQHLVGHPCQKGMLYYGRDGVNFASLGIGKANQVLTVSNGVPTWAYLLSTGLAANRPTSGTFAGQQYFATDTFALSIWTGSAWKSVALS